LLSAFFGLIVTPANPSLVNRTVDGKAPASANTDELAWRAAVVVIVFQSLVELFGMVAYLRWLPRLIRDTH
jgi:hypothetical protein